MQNKLTRWLLAAIVVALVGAWSVLAQPTNVNILTNAVGGVGQLLVGSGTSAAVIIASNAGAPTNGTAGTLAGRGYIGSWLLDVTNKHFYINENTIASPTWVRPDDNQYSYVAPSNGDVIDSHFFIADRAYTVTRVDEIHTTVCSDPGAVTLQARKTTGVQAPASGVALTTATFSLKGTVETVLNGTLTATAADLDLAVGNRLSADITGVTAACAGIVMTVTMKRK